METGKEQNIIPLANCGPFMLYQPQYGQNKNLQKKQQMETGKKVKHDKNLIVRHTSCICSTTSHASGVTRMAFAKM